MINKSTEIPYWDIDEEIIEVIKALNSIDGVETTSCCCGHKERPCLISFTVKDIKTIVRLCHYCFNHEGFWIIGMNNGDPHLEWTDLHFILESRRICNQKDFDDLAYKINRWASEINNLTNRVDLKEKIMKKYLAEHKFDNPVVC